MTRPVLTILLLLSCPAKADPIAILEVRFSKVPPALKTQIRSQMKQQLQTDGYKVINEDDTARRLQANNVPPGCQIGPCLSRVGNSLNVKRVVSGSVTSQGTSFDIILTMLETGGGSVLAQVNERCDVCTFQEVEKLTTRTASMLHKKSLVFLSTKTALTVESTPQGADVLLDGLTKGKTPLVRILDPGRHIVEVAARGYTSTTQQVMLAAGKKQTINVRLIPRTSGLENTRSKEPGFQLKPWVKWLVLGAGVVVGGIGGGLLAMDGNETSDPRYVRDTKTVGITMISIGAATALASTLFTFFERDRGRSDRGKNRRSGDTSNVSSGLVQIHGL